MASCLINFRESLDSQGQKEDQGVSTAVESANCGFEGTEVLGISVCHISNQ